MKLFAVIDEQNEHVLAVLAREMLQQQAKENGVAAEVHLRGQAAPLTLPAAQNADDVLLFLSAGAEKPPYEELAAQFRGAVIIAGRDEVFNAAAALWQKIKTPQPNAAANAPAAAPAAGTVRKLVAVTSCPTGIAHTFMAAEALQEGAKALGLAIRVETQGSVGSGTPLTAEEISAADLVLIAADREVERSRFDGKYVYSSGTKAAIADGKAYIQAAISQARRQNGSQAAAESDAAAGSGSKGGFYPPLMTGVSFMLPFVVAGGLLIALGLALGGVNVAEQSGTLAHYLWQIGAKSVFPLIVPVLAGYIAFAIGDRPALAPGMAGGFLSDQIGSGFIGGIIAGFLAGYITKAAARYIQLPRSIAGLKPVLILPLFCTAATGLIMLYVFAEPTAWLLQTLTEWVRNLESQSSGALLNGLLLGAVLGGMMAADMGGPINKAAYTTAIGLLSVKIYTPMAAAMLGGMTPPMALALACYLRPRCFTEKERGSKEATFIMGLAFISEGAIPFAGRDPLRVIPCLIAGSAVAGALAVVTATGIVAPHGGIFLLPIKGAISNYAGYFTALIAGTATSAACLCFFCRRAPAAENKQPA